MKKTTLFLSFILCFGVLGMFSAVDLPTTGSFGDASIPAGWTYITNNSQYPDAGFYTSPKGLKMNFENMGMESPEFNAQSLVSVTLTIGALNQNTKTTAASQDVFTITGLNSTGIAVATTTLKSVEVGDNSAVLSGNDIVKVKIIMTGYPSDGEKYCNVNLSSIALSSGPSGLGSLMGEQSVVYVSGNELIVKNVEIGTAVEFYNALGAKVQTSAFDGSSIDLSNLSKGIYIVRAGKHVQKIMF